ncbi:steroid 5-alpha reductase family enzyme [Kitasatospora sp. SolWspMP-SS2h]|nr:steroid 5-alpha reductase family enzyme [Kitasatospora sp. SolWspMP-SS2h]
MNAAAFGIGAACTAGAALAVMLLAFAVGVRTGRHRGVDVAWGLAFTAVALTGYGLSAGYGDGGRRALATVLVAVWGLRLAAHLWWRARGLPEDPRYARMLSRAPEGPARTRYALRTVYLLQAVLVWFVSLPVLAAQYLPDRLGPTAWAGAALWAVGLFFEAVGDAQLARFKADPAHRGRVMDRGLWRYTRHPNYFGDACVWWGLFLLVAHAPIGWAFVGSPLLMTWLLAFGSGKPMLEKHLSSGERPGWAEYTARTSSFFPLPPRRRSPRAGG